MVLHRITTNSSNGIPNFFTIIEVNLLIRSELLRIDKYRIVLIGKGYLIESLVLKLIYIKIGYFKDVLSPTGGDMVGRRVPPGAARQPKCP